MVVVHKYSYEGLSGFVIVLESSTMLARAQEGGAMASH